MGLYNFQARFVPWIRSGAKKHTIRAMRKHPDEPGDIMHLYTGLRTKKAKLIDRVGCVKVEEIAIAEWHGTFLVRVDGEYLDGAEKERLARADGFKNFADMMAFWKGRLPFEGQIIHWK